MHKVNKHHSEPGPTLAPGMNDHDELEQSATEKEVEKGEYTSVTTFSFDEVDPSDD
jgi:hypothetical protein